MFKWSFNKAHDEILAYSIGIWRTKKKRRKVCYFHLFLDVFLAVFFFCVSPTLPGAIWAKWVFIDSCVICFQKIFSPIWTIWVWTKSCWGPCGKSFGPKWTFRTFLPSQQKLSSKANKANLLFSRFFRPLFQPLFWPIWTFGLCTKSCWDPFRKSSGPTWKSRPSVPAQQKPLSKSIWANLDFIQCCSTCSKNCFGLFGPVGLLWNPIGTPAGIHLDQIGMLGHLCHSTRNWFSHFQTTCWSNDDPHVGADQNKKKLLKNVLVLFKECIQSGLRGLSWNLLRHKRFKRYSKEESLKSLTAQNTTSSKVYRQKT